MHYIQNLINKSQLMKNLYFLRSYYEIDTYILSALKEFDSRSPFKMTYHFPNLNQQKKQNKN